VLSISAKGQMAPGLIGACVLVPLIPDALQRLLEILRDGKWTKTEKLQNTLTSK